MKQKFNMVLAVFLGWTILFPASGWTNPPTTVEEHLAKVKYYEDQAKTHEAIVAEHEKMYRDYKEEVGFTPKWKRFYAGKIESMRKHCLAIAKKAETMAREFLKMAEWHKMRANEMKAL